MFQIEEQLPVMLISWLPFSKDSHILVLGEAVSCAAFLRGKGCLVETAESAPDLTGYDKAFDFIFANNILETAADPEVLLRSLKRLVKPDGVVYIGADNRLGLRYLCGEKDPYTGRVFDSIENYKYAPKGENRGRCYSRIELEELFFRCGYTDLKFYSVFPCLEAAQLIFSDQYRANEELSIRYTPLYRDPDSVLMREERLFADAEKMGILAKMANAYLIEYTPDGHHTAAESISISYDRGEACACATILGSDGTVVKRAVYPQGNAHIRQLAENMTDLRRRRVPVAEGALQDDAYVMPYLSGPTGNVYLQGLMRSDVGKFIEGVDHFRELILRSSEMTGEGECGPLLRKGYFDLIPLNSIYHDGEFVFIDQEFCMEDYPLNVILYRAIYVIYDNVPEREKILPKAFFWERYGISDQIDRLRQYGDSFMNILRNRVSLQAFNDSHMRNNWVMERNRKKIMTMDFYEEYKRNCFRDLDGKQIILFGSGRFADKFLAFYRQDYPILRIVDNDQRKWGSRLQGIPIESPESIMADRSGCKVIICIKDYENVFHQLKRMNVPHIGIYDAHYIYPGRQQRQVKRAEPVIQKRFRVGYVSGVFDLFHIGHINLLRRAKEQCDYLIAAVTSDEYVRERKHKEPFIPFDERLEVLKACKYVDEAVGVPARYAGTVDAFQKYHFDCQFVGSDYMQDPWWLRQKEYLEGHGSTLVFLPYTEQTSSTRIRALIDQKLV